ncbi:MAG: flagellar hook-basal body complex protein, partial [Planctomycetes bacterium]|nr:flagellar hook-basal body complex protein [Planctomycetota bacterium]
RRGDGSVSRRDPVGVEDLHASVAVVAIDDRKESAMVSRWIPLSLVFATACQAPAGPAGYREASFSLAEAALESTPRVLEDIAAELLCAADSALAVEQRVRCENIANVDTCGYRRRTVQRSSAQIAGRDGDGCTSPQVIGVIPVWTGGVLELTERMLDVAIDGDGLFAILLADGSTGYSRDGQFRINADGKVVTHRGCVLLPEITIPCDTLEITVDPAGMFSGRTAGSPDTATVFGQIVLHRFINPAGLRAEGHVWRPTEDSGAPFTGKPGLYGLGQLKQGFLERSNVDLGKELLALQLIEKRRDALARLMQRYGLRAP